jgi:hypothetical protein
MTTTIVITKGRATGFKTIYREDHPTIKPILKAVKAKKMVPLKDMCAYKFNGTKNELMIARLQGNITLDLLCVADMDLIESKTKELTDAYYGEVKVYNDSIYKVDRDTLYKMHSALGRKKKQLMLDIEQVVLSMVQWEEEDRRDKKVKESFDNPYKVGDWIRVHYWRGAYKHAMVMKVTKCYFWTCSPLLDNEYVTNIEWAKFHCKNVVELDSGYLKKWFVPLVGNEDIITFTTDESKWTRHKINKWNTKFTHVDKDKRGYLYEEHDSGD